MTAKHTPATPLQGDPAGLEMFKLQGHTRLTDCVISRVATEIPNATPADMAIALRNHAYSLEHDRAKLVEALRFAMKHTDNVFALANRHDREMDEYKRHRALLRELGEEVTDK